MALIHTCYRITDIDRSVAFYNALGSRRSGGIPIGDEAVNVFMNQPGDGDMPRLELTYNFGVDPYEIGTGYGHIAITTDDLDAHPGTARRAGDRAREASLLRPRGRLAAVLRARSRRVSHRDDRAGLTRARERLGRRPQHPGRRPTETYSDRPWNWAWPRSPTSTPGAGPDRVAQRLRELLEEIELADQLGMEVFGLGEHHRPDYAVSSTAVALAAAAARTEKIRLSSAVTVLSSADPVRVFQEFATLDLLSGGRAEIMAGRGSFIESFQLFGYDLDDYDELFAEKLGLLLKLRESERVTWSGKHRAALNDIGVYPRPIQQPLPVWIAVGGTPGSVARAGALGLPLMIAIIGGAPARFAPLVELYRESAAPRRGRSAPGWRWGSTRTCTWPTPRSGRATSSIPRTRR